MVYMSRMPVGGKEGQPRVGKRQGDGGAERSAGTDGGSSVGERLEVECELFGPQHFCEETWCTPIIWQYLKIFSRIVNFYVG